jgi:hypothetical protein
MLSLDVSAGWGKQLPRRLLRSRLAVGIDVVL